MLFIVFIYCVFLDIFYGFVYVCKVGFLFKLNKIKVEEGGEKSFKFWII